MNEQSTTQPAARNVPLGYLRTFITLLVIAHHAVLAYHAYAPPPGHSLHGSPIWTAFPIVDSQRWPGIDLFVGFNDTFFMALMFFVSGVFAWPSLVRRGAAAFARERTVRLGVPFLIAAGLLAPLAYYPSYLQVSHQPGFDPGTDGFWHQWLTLGAWPAGSAWFLWVLLAFGLLAAALYKLAPGWGDALGAISGRLSTRPVVYYVALLAVSALGYLPMAALFNPMRWVSFGPFYIQISRLLLYAAYFFAGAGAGAYGIGRGLLAPDGKLARRWPLWIGATVITFVLALVVLLTIVARLAKGGASFALLTFGNFNFALVCGAASLAFLALFLRFSRRSNRWFDSLGRNAYGMYILHYVFVSWLQLALLHASLSAPAKGSLVFLGATLGCWTLTAALRRIPVIARIL